jgi:hypothetical protein
MPLRTLLALLLAEYGPFLITWERGCFWLVWKHYAARGRVPGAGSLVRLGKFPRPKRVSNYGNYTYYIHHIDQLKSL